MVAPVAPRYGCSTTGKSFLRSKELRERVNVPEIAVVLVVALTFLGARALWRTTPVPVAGRASDLQQSRYEDTQHMRARLVAACVMWVIISIPLILKLVPPNGIYGFRIPATQASRAIWYPANAFMGWAL